MKTRSPVDSIVESTFGIMRLLRKQHAASRKPHSMNFLQIHALACIAEHPGMTMKEVAESLQIMSPTATSFVSRLVKAGFVRRFDDTKNRKIVRLRLSTKGALILRKKMLERKKVFRTLFHFLPLNEQRQLAFILKKLLISLHSV